MRITNQNTWNKEGNEREIRMRGEKRGEEDRQAWDENS